MLSPRITLAAAATAITTLLLLVASPTPTHALPATGDASSGKAAAASLLLNHPNTPDSLRLSQPAFDWASRDQQKMSHDQALANQLKISYSGSGSERHPSSEQQNTSFSSSSSSSLDRRTRNRLPTSPSALVGKTENDIVTKKQQQQRRFVKRAATGSQS